MKPSSQREVAERCPFSFLFWGLFRAPPAAYQVPRLGIEPAFLWTVVGFVTTKPGRELLFLFSPVGRGRIGAPEVDYRLNRDQPEPKGLTDFSGLQYNLLIADSNLLETK